MAVVPTGEIFKTLTFDGQSSGDYGVYITGEAVYNAPARDVEMVTIPGRNGQLALDKGRFENIEVSYPAGIFADNEAGFAQAVSDFRNFLASHSGYCRLEDDYNSNEYRMAVYKSGLEVDPKLLRAGKFNIVFDCKPQRWLTSGETAVTVASGDTLTNPTLFESSPLLEIDGVGDIEFNGYTVSIESSDTGEVVIPYTQSGDGYTLDLSQLNTGDRFTVSGMSLYSYRSYKTVASVTKYRRVSSTIPTGWSAGASRVTEYTTFVHAILPDIVLSNGTPYTSETVIIQCTGTGTKTSDGTALTWHTVDRVTFSYDGANTITLSVSRNDTLSTHSTSATRGVDNITGYSTKPYDYGTIFCDTDIGDFYRIEGGEYISMNHVGDLGSDLPTLAPGTNTVTYDNTITELNIAPRWWKI